MSDEIRDEEILEEEVVEISEDSGLVIEDLDESVEQVIEEIEVTEESAPEVEEVEFSEAVDIILTEDEEGVQPTEEEIAMEIAAGDPPPDTTQVGRRMETEERWYVLHTFNGYEVVAKDNLEKVIEKYNLQDRVKELYIPTEDVVVEKRGKKTLVPTRTMPSYVFIKMIYGDDLWHMITRTRGITGFAGPKGRPLPLSAKEVISMKLERKANVISVDIEVDDTVQVIDGPLGGQTAVVTTVDVANKKCTVTVNMFGRPTTVELAFSQVKKI
ncbi:MAG: transcription termination/antitermination protein NusG [Firmicutes bacterium]|nr:transcription termination/antitermination protein NusG [Bacillota bacterium]